MLGINEEAPIEYQTCKNLRKWPLIQETEETLVSSSALPGSENSLKSESASHLAEEVTFTLLDEMACFATTKTAIHSSFFFLVQD